MNQREKMKRRRKFKVGVRKDYFPRDLWPKEIMIAYVEVVKVFATSRTEAADKVWQKHGQRWIAQMTPGRLAVSLDVNEPTISVSGTLGRLRAINVYQSDDHPLRRERYEIEEPQRRKAPTS